MFQAYLLTDSIIAHRDVRFLLGTGQRRGVAIDTARSNQTEVYPRGAETPRAPSQASSTSQICRLGVCPDGRDIV